MRHHRGAPAHPRRPQRSPSRRAGSPQPAQWRRAHPRGFGFFFGIFFFENFLEFFFGIFFGNSFGIFFWNFFEIFWEFFGNSFWNFWRAHPRGTIGSGPFGSSRVGPGGLPALPMRLPGNAPRRPRGAPALPWRPPPRARAPRPWGPGARGDVRGRVRVRAPRIGPPLPALSRNCIFVLEEHFCEMRWPGECRARGACRRH